ncbi:MAG: type VI secretion system contractile sheath large subunit [Thermodesulfobacteriota bacterium]
MPPTPPASVDTAPFAVLALAPLAGDDAPPRPSVTVTAENLDAVVAALEPTLALQVPAALNPQGVLGFSFARMADFHPDTFGGDSGLAAEAARAAAFVDQALAAGTAAADIHAKLADWPGLNLALPAPQAAAPQKPAAGGGSAADQLFAMVDAPGAADSDRAQALAWKDKVLARRREVLGLAFSDPGFRRMEAAWRGVEMLARRPAFGPGGRCTLAVAPAGARRLDKCLNTLEVLMATESASLVLLDAPLDASQVGAGRMARLAALGGRFVTPVAAWADTGFLHLRDWKDFDGLPGIPSLLDGPAYIPWRKLRTSADSAWFALLMGRFLARPQYGPGNPTDCGLTEAEPSWAAPVWALGAMAADAAQASGWAGAFTLGRGLDVHLPAGAGEADSPTEYGFSDRRAVQLAEAGLLPLLGVKREARAIAPRAGTVGGAPLNYALFLNLVTRHVYHLRGRLNHHSTREETERQINASFTTLWPPLGPLAPQTFQATLGQGQPGGLLPLKIELVPSPLVLPGGPKISLDFEW